MSAEPNLVVRCPHCSEDFAEKAVMNLHVTREPSRRQAILDRKFQRYTCPHCAGSVRVQPTLLYSDFERWQWYATFPFEAIVHRSDMCRKVMEGFRHNMEVACPPMVREWAPKFRIRVVFGLPSLREKLLCDDHGVDDRTLEILKWRLLRDVASEALSPNTEFVLDAITPEHFVFEVAPPPGADGTQVVRVIQVGRSQLDPVLALDVAERARRFPHLYEGPVVDWRAPLHPDRPMDTDS